MVLVDPERAIAVEGAVERDRGEEGTTPRTRGFQVPCPKRVRGVVRLGGARYTGLPGGTVELTATVGRRGCTRPRNPGLRRLVPLDMKTVVSRSGNVPDPTGFAQVNPGFAFRR